MNDSISSADVDDFISCDHNSVLSLEQEFTPTILRALISLIDE